VAAFTAAGGNIHSSRGQHSQQQVATFTTAGATFTAAGATLIHRSSIAQQKQQQNFTAAQ